MQTAAIPLLCAAASLAAESPAPGAGAERAARKIKLGLVGCGGRGSWIAQLFKQHGGYELHAVADYFRIGPRACGRTLGVDKSRCFSGLSGYKKVIESGVEAIALETPPGFFPEHARAAVEAGLHVYVAKPVAVDVPGCLTIEAAGKTATQKQRVSWSITRFPPTRPISRWPSDPQGRDRQAGQGGHQHHWRLSQRSAEERPRLRPAGRELG